MKARIASTGIARGTVRKVMRLTQRAQAATNGYFGGYIGKRQPAGKLETKKCVDEMLTLRARQAGKSFAQQQRAVSARMITDIEMNGTLRGAVEVFNLARHLRENDSLFPECVRTFATRDVDARSWLYRLEIEHQHDKGSGTRQRGTAHSASTGADGTQQGAGHGHIRISSVASAVAFAVSIRVLDVLARRGARTALRV